MQVGEGEQHAGGVADLERLAAQQHGLLAPVRQAEAALHLWDGRAGMQPRDRQVAPLGAAQHVDLVHGMPDQRVAGVAGQFEKAVIDLDVAHVGEADDDRRGRVGAERALEPLLRVEPLRLVVEDHHQAVGLAGWIGQRHGADLMHPTPAGGATDDLDQRLVDRLAPEQALHGVLVRRQLVLAPVAQLKAYAVAVRRAAQFRKIGDAVQRKRGVVVP